ncbi:MAG: hypothetical protein A2V99_17705 [Spirochaetes bacterium RBG_16_67_19]|nr:MAG: hypothetical protein A2V99_17705 [Spirochaetes bacterium RBG_16_67_19]
MVARLLLWSLIRCLLGAGLLAAAGDGRLAESGPFQVIRHPLSAGLQLLLLGAALALGSPGGLLAGGPLALLLWAAHARFLEEPALHRRFPDSTGATPAARAFSSHRYISGPCT